MKITIRKTASDKMMCGGKPKKMEMGGMPPKSKKVTKELKKMGSKKPVSKTTSVKMFESYLKSEKPKTGGMKMALGGMVGPGNGILKKDKNRCWDGKGGKLCTSTNVPNSRKSTPKKKENKKPSVPSFPSYGNPKKSSGDGRHKNVRFL